MDVARILVVEDEQIVALDLASGLRKLGFQVMGPLTTGEQAIKLVAEDKPDLILMDIRLRGSMTGIEAAKAITTAYDIPILFITAYSHDEILEQALAAGASGFLLKPFVEKGLEDAVLNCLESPRNSSDMG